MLTDVSQNDVQHVHSNDGQCTLTSDRDLIQPSAYGTISFLTALPSTRVSSSSAFLTVIVVHRSIVEVADVLVWAPLFTHSLVDESESSAYVHLSQWNLNAVHTIRILVLLPTDACQVLYPCLSRRSSIISRQTKTDHRNYIESLKLINTPLEISMSPANLAVLRKEAWQFIWRLPYVAHVPSIWDGFYSLPVARLSQHVSPGGSGTRSSSFKSLLSHGRQHRYSSSAHHEACLTSSSKKYTT